jgi:hypothetical protein
MTKVDFACSNQYMHIQIVLNILPQFFAHTLAIVTFNIRVDYMSIGSLVRGLLVKIDFASLKDIQIILNILPQFFAHTLAALTINKHVKFISIGFLVGGLLVIDDEN